jgi:hypothetical protein
MNIIRKPEYMGHTVNFRTYKTSFKTKKHKHNPPEKWEIFENTHDAIISPEEWETAQKCRKVKRRENKSGEANPLTGLVYCGTCGSRCIITKVRGTRKRVRRRIPTAVRSTASIRRSVPGTTSL